MGYKVFPCVICGKEVSRRKSVSLKELDGREERACKNHPEVIKILQDKINEAQIQKDMKEYAKTLRVMEGVALVRTAYTLRGMPPELIYFNLRRNGMPEDTISEIKKRVVEQGGLMMSQNEVLESLIVYSSALKSRKD